MRSAARTRPVIFSGFAMGHVSPYMIDIAMIGAVDILAVGKSEGDIAGTLCYVMTKLVVHQPDGFQSHPAGVRVSADSHGHRVNDHILLLLPCLNSPVNYLLSYFQPFLRVIGYAVVVKNEPDDGCAVLPGNGQKSLQRFFLGIHRVDEAFPFRYLQGCFYCLRVRGVQT